jgi:hypothetical protein
MKTAPKASAFPSASLVSLAAHIAKQAPIDTAKNAPTTPATAAATAAKSASKPSAVKVDRKAKAKQYKDIEFNVRGSGAHKLFAHTAAWLQLTGLIDGESAPVELVEDLGGSALRYHTKQGNFEQSQGRVTLTQKGTAKFIARQSGGHGAYAQEDMDHYMLMMIAGEKDDRLVKFAGNIKRLDK